MDKKKATEHRERGKNTVALVELTARQYAELEHITKQAVAQRRKAGKVEYRQNAKGEFLYTVEMPDGVEVPQAKTGCKDGTAAGGNLGRPSAGRQHALAEQVERLEAEKARLQDELAAALTRAQVAEQTAATLADALKLALTPKQPEQQQLPGQHPAAGQPEKERSEKVKGIFSWLKR